MHDVINQEKALDGIKLDVDSFLVELTAIRYKRA